MANRKWSQIENEVRSKVTTPLPVNRIITRVGIQYKQFKKLVELGVLKYVDSEKHNSGSSPKNYVAVRKVS